MPDDTPGSSYPDRRESAPAENTPPASPADLEDSLEDGEFEGGDEATEEDYPTEDECEELFENGTPLWIHAWDGPASGSYHIYPWRDGVFADVDGEHYLHATLDEVLEHHELTYINDAAASIEAPGLPTDEVLSRLKLNPWGEGGDRHVFTVNGEPVQYRDGAFRRLASGDPGRVAFEEKQARREAR